MGDLPEFSFHGEELTLEISNLGGSYALAHLAEMKIFESFEVQFPHEWEPFKISVAQHILDTTWHLHARVLLETALTAGINYSTKDGTSGSLGAEANLIAHLMSRPTTSVDLKLTAKIEGDITNRLYVGQPEISVGLVARY